MNPDESDKVYLTQKAGEAMKILSSITSGYIITNEKNWLEVSKGLKKAGMRLNYRHGLDDFNETIKYNIGLIGKGRSFTLEITPT